MRAPDSHLASRDDFSLLDLLRSWATWITIIVVVATLLAGLVVQEWVALVQIAFMEMIIGLAITLATNINERMTRLHYEAQQRIEQTGDRQRMLEEKVQEVGGEIELRVEKLREELGTFKKQVLDHSEILENVGEINDIEVLKDLASVSRSLSKLRPPLLLSVAKRELKEVSRKLKSMSTGATYTKHMQLGNEEVQHLFMYLMEAMPEGCCYDTVSYLDFWSHKVLADPLDFLGANNVASERGVKIRRIFLIFKELKTLETQEVAILRAHLDATQKSNGRIETKIAVSSDPTDLLGGFSNSAVCSKAGSSPLLIKMIYSQDGGKVRGKLDRVEIEVDDQQCRIFCAHFERLLEGSVDILDPGLELGGGSFR